MSGITYATVYSQGLGDGEASEAFERGLAALRRRGPSVYAHRIGTDGVEEGATFERTDPVDASRVVSRGLTADRAVVDRAVAAAREALPGWRQTPFDQRAAILGRTAREIERRVPQLAALISLETGKTRADAFAEVAECVAIVDLYRSQIASEHGYVVAQRAPAGAAAAEVVLLPYGVFGVIAPFNFPFAISFGMVAAALIAGNTVVFKPSALTPACGQAFLELFDGIGLPAGSLNLVQGGAATGEALVDSEVDGLAFTGSAEVGLGISARFTRPPFIRPVLAEMGGKNPAIVTEAAGDLEVAARAVARSAFGMSGQKCNACSRAVVIDGVYDAFVERLCEVTAELVVGDPIDASAFTGPVISLAARERFDDAVAMARRDGTVRIGGGSGTGGGHFVECTVVDGLAPGHHLTREELFLPVLSVVRVEDLDAALREANAVRYGLSAGIFSDDAAERARFLDEIEAGIVFVNNPGGATTGVWPGSQTMSGWKGSGSSGKGGFGPWYLQQFAREQSRTLFP